MTVSTAQAVSPSAPGDLPPWAQEMHDLFRSGAVAQFLVHGNIFDVVPAPGAEVTRSGVAAAPMDKAVPDGAMAGAARALSLGSYLDQVMFAGYDVVLHYDRGRGIRATRGAEDWGDWLQTTYGTEALKFAMMREPGPALELIDRYLLRTLNLKALARPTTRAPRKIAVVIDFAEFVVPRGEALNLGGEFAANVVKVLGWANDPAILMSNIATVLITEGLHDLNDAVVDNPHVAKLKVPLPGEAEMIDYVQSLAATAYADLPARCQVPLEVLARRLSGLSRVGARNVITLALKNGRTITAAYLAGMKKEMIERECQGLIEFLESPFTLDHVAGNEAVKAWLREDVTLLRRGVLHALPMGYLFAGRIGTGKTFIVQCWAGELGIPCVVFKNFRDRWVGATESNLDKIFAILRALGQVLVFVDEADQAAGKREGGTGDSGLSGRVYAMLAKEMSDTRNRGRIIWVFATSRPDLLEVDLKRQGRLDVHIPLFPPQTPGEVRDLLKVVARKFKFPLADADLPDIPEQVVLGGNELEGSLVRALRIFELQSEPRRPLKEILEQVFRELRPSAHTRKLEYMDLVAVRECTDARFLPQQYHGLSPEEIDTRIDQLRSFV
ncbi:MAG: AAA family ATPase [Phycisphaeraceae bacterium]